MAMPSAPETGNACEELSRRDFLKTTAALGAGLAIGVALPGHAAGRVALQTAGAPLDEAQLGQFNPNAWLSITPDNRIVFVLDRVEMGQGTMTSHPTLIAEELEVEPARIEIVFAQGLGGAYVNSAPNPKVQITGGSASVKNSWEPLRRAGATAREMLRSAAAKRFGVPLAEVSATNGQLLHAKSGRRLSYGQVCVAAAQERVGEVALKRPQDFKYIGKPQKRLDLHQKVMATAQYGIDVQVPGMVYAFVLHSPTLRGAPKAIDDAACKAQAGFIASVALPHGVAVVASHWYQAKAAAALLKVEWEAGPLASTSSAAISRRYHELARNGTGKSIRSDGNAENGFRTASKIIEASYEAPYLAHATMEPQNCTAFFNWDECEIWAPTQFPQLARETAARVSGLAHARIRVNQTFLGGGFGRRIPQDYVEEAVRVSMAVKKPVKVLWSREEDMRNDFFRPAAVNYYKAGLGKNGEVTGFLARVVTESIVAAAAPDFISTLSPTWLAHGVKRLGAGMAARAFRSIAPDGTATEGTASFAYAFPNHRVEYINQNNGIPIGFWRSVGHSFNAFMTESFVDEMAHAAGVDPLLFRRRLLKGSPRLLGVLELAAAKAGWGTPPAPGVFRGIAVARSFETDVAHVVEVSVQGTEYTIKRIVSTVDCGLVVNPDIVRSQIESAVIFGLSAARYGQITINNGQVQQSNFHDYQVLRINECPPIEVHIVASEASPTGIGEPGLPPLAPALANALFAATGKRLRKLPLSLA